MQADLLFVFNEVLELNAYFCTSVPPAYATRWRFMSNAVAQIIDDLRKRGGLKATDVANITTVSLATVSQWTSGRTFPHPKTQLRISNLCYVVERLAEFYSPADMRIWLYSSHRLLNGQRAIDLIRDGRDDEVLAVIESLADGTYI